MEISTIKTMGTMVATKIKSVGAKAMKKMPGDSQLVVAIVLVAVAVGLCIIFRNQINTLITGIMSKLSTTITNMTSGTLTSQSLTQQPS